MTTTTLYGITTCDSCRKAKRYLAEHGVEARYHDVRKDGLTIQMLEQWADSVSWETLLNQRSLTWRKIPSLDRQNLNRAKALGLILDHPTVLKRPVLVTPDTVIIGFDQAAYAALAP